MDGKRSEPDTLQGQDSVAASGSQVKLAAVIDALERGLEDLDELGLTLAVALLDHAIAEAKRHLTG